MYFSWNHEKNEQLVRERGISFEEVVFHIERGDVLDVLERPNDERSPEQRLFVVAARGRTPVDENDAAATLTRRRATIFGRNHSELVAQSGQKMGVATFYVCRVSVQRKRHGVIPG